MEAIKKDLVGVDEINTSVFEDAIFTFSKVVEEQYFSIKNKSFAISHVGIFDDDSIDKIKHSKDRMNYEMAALNGENVIVFKKPYLVSTIYCSSHLGLNNDKSSALRLISYKGTTKKIVPLISEKEQKYVVDEVVWGVIMPNHSSLLSAKMLDLESFFKNESKLLGMAKAHKNIISSVNSLKESILEKFSKVNASLSEKNKMMHSSELQLQSLLNEKERIESSIRKEQIISERIGKDINNATNELSKIQNKVDSRFVRAEELQAQIKHQKDKLVIDKDESKKVSEQLIDSRQELNELQEQLIRAKADINVTTLDMKGFSEESKNQISNYFWLAITSIIFLAIIFGFLYENATTFSDLFDANPTASAWNILLSRLPLITATALVIGTLSALLFYLVNNIISVNENKMNMLKASILAEQITGSLSKKDMTDEEIRDFKRNTKIELVMSVFSGKADNLKEEKQNDIIKQLSDALKSLKP